MCAIFENNLAFLLCLFINICLVKVKGKTSIYNYYWHLTLRTVLNTSQALNIVFLHGWGMNRGIWTTFVQYNTQAENFNINSRLQWRFAPMSDIFLVYTDNYLVQTDDMTDDFRIESFAAKNRALVFKVNYWFTL